MEEIQKEGADPKEIQQEEELLKETPDDEVRTSIVEEYGLNEEADSELIEKLTESKVASNKSLSTAIKQKRGWREKATARTEQEPEEKPEEKPQTPAKTEVGDKTLSQQMDEKLDERELDSLEISDELKQEIKTYAKVSGLSVKQALKSDYIKYLEDKEKATQKVEEASIGGKRGAPSRQDFDLDNPPKPDMSSEEGRKEWAAWKEYLNTH